MLRAWFEKHGWWATAAPLYDADDIAEIIPHFDDVLAGRYDLGQPAGVNNFGQLRKVSNAWLADSVIRRVVLAPGIATLAAELLGVPELYLWADSLYWKQPFSGEQSRIGWHQDKQYWKTIPTDQMITACVNLYPAGLTSGGLRFASGSHRWGLIGGDALSGGDNTGPHEFPHVPSERKWCEVCPELPPGNITFHHSLTFHGSGPNYTVAPRRSITIHMASAEAKLDGPQHPRLFP